MANRYIVPLLSPRAPFHRPNQAIGSKARNLCTLARLGFAVPTTHVCTWEAFARYLNDDLSIVETLQAELAAQIDPERRYAVRSSANLEDTLHFSFAGQFKSVLDVQGVKDILQAIWSIWESAGSPGVCAYLERHNLAPDMLKMAVLIQEMVAPQVSGVAFSKNPLTGLNEVIVEAVKGSGIALVQEGVTPGRWVNKQDEWTAQPEVDTIDLGLIQRVVDGTRAIAKAYGHPVDLEWVYDGRQIYWVQMREITSLDVDVYSNRISREMTPGLLKPLVWSACRQVNHAWMRILTEVLGPNDIQPESLTALFYYRSYFNMGTFGRIFERMGLPREALEQMMGIEARRAGGNPMSGMMRHMMASPQARSLLPRLIRFGLDKLRLARKLEAFLPAAQARYQAFRRIPVDQLDAQALLDEVDRIGRFVQEVAYYDILSIMSMQMVNSMLKRRLRARGIDAENLELGSEMPELEPFDPTVHLTTLHESVGRLGQDVQNRIAAAGYGLLSELDEAGPLRAGIERFTNQFDYLRDRDIDLSCTPWGADPEQVLAMAIRYNPPAVSRSFDELLAQVGASQQRKLRAAYRQARRFRLYRETVGTLYKRSYDLLRPRFLALGAHLTQRSLIASPEDVFYLYLEELRELIAPSALDTDERSTQDMIAERKQELARCAAVTPPDTIYGDQAAPLQVNVSNMLQGTPVSRGHYTGPARVVQGIQDFHCLCDGDVLIIPYSDVGWTPLFSRAGAVVAESGGMLSHSAIIAREYNIPAVVSVPGACLLANNTLVSVDGYRGEIVIHSTDVHPDVPNSIELPVTERSAT